MRSRAMNQVLKRVFDLLGVNLSTNRLGESDRPGSLESEKQMSLHPTHRDTIVVVVELGSEFDIKSGSCLRRQYLYYPFRETADFRRIVCLKAAYRNGVRIEADHAGSVYVPSREANARDAQVAGNGGG